MHGLFCGGVFNVIMFLVLADVQRYTGSTKIWDDVATYIATWHWPKSLKFQPDKTQPFNKKRVSAFKKANTIKRSASDGLSMLPVLTVFIRLIVYKRGICTSACEALFALCELVELLAVAPMGLASPQRVRAIVAIMLDRCKAAGWEESMIPKFHWAIHYAHNLERWGLSPTCWTHERKHKLCKRYAEGITNRQAYAMSVLSEVMSHQLHDVSQPDSFDLSLGLIDARKADKRISEFVLGELGLPDATEVLMSQQCRVPPTTMCWKRDVVLIKRSGQATFVAGQIWFMVSMGARCVALINQWGLDSTDAGADMHADWDMREAPCLVNLAEILTPVVWTEYTPGIVRTLIPLQFRGFRPNVSFVSWTMYCRTKKIRAHAFPEFYLCTYIRVV